MGSEEGTGAPIPYVFLAGAPYSGSTLLSFLMNAHPDCLCLGETNGLTAGVVPEQYRCSCGELFLACGFWKGVASRMEAEGYPIDLPAAEWLTEFRASSNRYLNYACIGPLASPWLDALRNQMVAPLRSVQRRLTRTGLANAALARAALAQSSASIFVDASKGAQRIRFLARTPGTKLRVIHLVRDVRGGAASYMRYTQVSARSAARQWVVRNRLADRARRHVPPDCWFQLRYSDLCADVQGTMDRISEFIGAPTSPVPEDVRGVEHHVVGNRMRLSDRIEIREDLSWQSRLSEDELAGIARVAGATNHHFGYPWPDGA